MPDLMVTVTINLRDIFGDGVRKTRVLFSPTNTPWIAGDFALVTSVERWTVTDAEGEGEVELLPGNYTVSFDYRKDTLTIGVPGGAGVYPLASLIDGGVEPPPAPAFGVSSVNGKTGAVELDAQDVGAAAANDPRFPSAGQAAALAGTSGTPGSGNRYVTDQDSRLSNGRPPTGGAGGVLSGSYPNPGFATDMATQAELDAHTANTSNPHGVTTTQIGAETPAGAQAKANAAEAAAKLASIPLTQKGALSGVATLDAGGKLPTGQLPDLAVVEYLGPSAHQSAMLALVGQSGDWTIRTDLGTVWIITGPNPSQLSSWTQMGYPTAPVQSVAGKTGVVELEAHDVGAAAADDARFPSAGQTAALAGTSGTPGSGNRYVTDQDSRLSNGRPPTGGAGGVLSGSYPNPGFATDMATQAELDAHTANTSNPHGVTKTQVGLSNVPNVNATARASHSGTQTASTISDFSSAASAAAPVQSVAGKTGAVTLAKGDVGLGNVDNTSDLNKPISTATQTALNGKLGASATAVAASSLSHLILGATLYPDPGPPGVRWVSSVGLDVLAPVQATTFIGNGQYLTHLTTASLTPGTNGQILTTVGGVATWAAAPSPNTPVEDLVAGEDVEISLAGDHLYRIEVDAETSFIFVDTPKPGAVVMVTILSNTGEDVTWPVGITWAGATPPLLQPATGTLVEFLVISDTMIQGAWLI